MISDFVSYCLKGVTQGLGNLKQESISKACRSLVKKRLGKEAETHFKEAYKIRAKIFQTGLVPSGINFGSFVPRCDELVSKLIIQDVKAVSFIL
jgi:hypothetical protein